MQHNTFGRTSGSRLTVSSIGLGGMPMSIEGRPARDQALATIHASLEAGVTLIDTADAYHLSADDLGHNEELVAEALRTWGGDTSGVLVTTKGGHLRPGDGRWTQDGRPEHLKAAARASAARLGVEAIGLYQVHRPDPQVPYAESIGALVELLEEGVIVHAGISNVSVDQIEEADRVLGGRLAAIENRFSPGFTRTELEHCAARGIGFLAYAPLGGMGDAADLGALFAPFRVVAERHGVSPQQVALAWEISLSPVMVPIPGASRPASARNSAAAADLVLSDEDLALLATVPEQRNHDA